MFLLLPYYPLHVVHFFTVLRVESFVVKLFIVMKLPVEPLWSAHMFHSFQRTLLCFQHLCCMLVITNHTCSYVPLIFNVCWLNPLLSFFYKSNNSSYLLMIVIVSDDCIPQPFALLFDHTNVLRLSTNVWWWFTSLTGISWIKIEHETFLTDSYSNTTIHLDQHNTIWLHVCLSWPFSCEWPKNIIFYLRKKILFCMFWLHGTQLFLLVILLLIFILK